MGGEEGGEWDGRQRGRASGGYGFVGLCVLFGKCRSGQGRYVIDSPFCGY